MLGDSMYARKRLHPIGGLESVDQVFDTTDAFERRWFGFQEFSCFLHSVGYWLNYFPGSSDALPNPVT